MHQKEVVEIINNYGPLALDLVAMFYIGRIVHDMKHNEVVTQKRMLKGIALFGIMLVANLPWLTTLFDK